MQLPKGGFTTISEGDSSVDDETCSEALSSLLIEGNSWPRGQKPLPVGAVQRCSLYALNEWSWVERSSPVCAPCLDPGWVIV